MKRFMKHIKYFNLAILIGVAVLVGMGIVSLDPQMGFSSIAGLMVFGSIGWVPGGNDYTTATGSQNIPKLFSSKLLQKYYPKSLLTYTSNTAFEGELKQMGDEVVIPTLGNVTVRDYVKGQKTIWEEIVSQPVKFTINRAVEWAIKQNTIDAKQFVVKGLIDKYAADAAEQTRIVIDRSYLASIYLDAGSYNQGIAAGMSSGFFNLGVTGTPIVLNKANIITYLMMCEAVLNEADVPMTGRWVALPTWARFLLDDSEIKDASLTGLAKSSLVDESGYIRNIGKFRVYESNLYTPVVDSGAGKTCYNILFGIKDAVTTATQLVETKNFTQFENDWGQGMKGLQVYDWKVIKGQGLGVLYASISSVF